MTTQTDAELKNTQATLETSLDATVGKPSKQLEDNLTRFLDDCTKRSEFDWKTNAMNLSKSSILDAIEHWNESEEEPDLKNMMDLHLRWIIPIPPDPEKVAYVIARDRAAYEKEQAERLVGK